MASQQPTDREGGGEGEREEGAAEKAEGIDGTGPQGSVEAADSRRIGPWHPPDYQRQRALADRLSNPALRSSRPATSSGRSQPHTLTASLTSSPYHPRPQSRSASNSDGHRMNSSRASSGPPNSPRYLCSPRRQTSSASPRYGAVTPRRQPPLYQTPATTRKVTEDELDGIVERITKPTVSSRGGVDLLDKDFTYIQTPRLKTLPVVPGLDRRYLGLQRVDSVRMEQIVQRLTRVTSASKAKFAPNRNVYVDLEPGAHMVAHRSAQSAM